MATTTRNKRRQIAEEAERQRLAQEEENDTDSDYEDNLPEQEQETSDQTISDDDVENVINIIDDDAETDTGINEKISKKSNKIRRPKTSWIWNFFKVAENNTKVICQFESCEKVLK
jgi:hypothetical protein